METLSGTMKRIEYGHLTSLSMVGQEASFHVDAEHSPFAKERPYLFKSLLLLCRVEANKSSRSCWGTRVEAEGVRAFDFLFALPLSFVTCAFLN